MQKREAQALYVAFAASSAPEVAAVVRRIFDRRMRFLVQPFLELGFRLSCIG
jgi:hypothetical protein